MKKTTFTFALTHRHRWELANLFFHESLEKGLPDIAAKKTFNRTRRALGLGPVADLMLSKTPIDSAYAFDSKERNSVILATEQVDFVLTRILSLPMTGVQCAILEDFIEAIEVAKATPDNFIDVEGIPPIPEKESWEHRNLAEEDESRFLFLLRDKAGRRLLGIRDGGTFNFEAAVPLDDTAKLFCSFVEEEFAKRQAERQGQGHGGRTLTSVPSVGVP